MPLTIEAHTIGYCCRCGGPLLSTDTNPRRWCASCMDAPVLVPVLPKLSAEAYNALLYAGQATGSQLRRDEAAREYEERREQGTTFRKSA